MKQKLLQLRLWYSQRETRERLFIVLFTIALFYALFSYILYNSVDYQRSILAASIKQKQLDIYNFNNKLDNLIRIKQSPLYQKWIVHKKNKAEANLQFNSISGEFPEKKWQEIYATLLKSPVNVNVLEINSNPESEYSGNAKLGRKIYQQRLEILLESNYFDFLNYLIYLEKKMPEVHWDSLTYTVTQYPLAHINLELSIFYEKPLN